MKKFINSFHVFVRDLIIMYFRSISLLALLFVITDEVNGYEVLINASHQAVEFGESLEVTCSTTCNNPQILVEYKPRLNPIKTQGDKWTTSQFPSVQEWDIDLPCTVICDSENPRVKEDKRVVPVYNRNLSIAALPEVLEVNKPYQLECTGPKVYPKNRLVLTWLRGSEVVQRNSTEDPGFPEDGPLKNVLDFIANISDDGMVYTCLAELILDSKTTKRIVNASETLQTYSFPEPPRILSKDPVEVNQETTLTCEVSNIYPAEKVRLRWFRDGVKWNSDVRRSDPTTVQATATWTPRETGMTELKCMADFEDYPSVSSKNDNIIIDMYVFSNPEIHIPITIEGIPVNITCSVFNVSGELQLRLKGNEILVNRSTSTGLTIYHTVNPGADQNGQQFTCKAELTLHHHSNTIVKEQPATLTVRAFPEPPRILSRDPVEVDQEVTLTCEVSNVYPAEKMRVRWFWDGEQQNSTTNQSDATTVRATTTWTPRETSLTEVSCTAAFEDYPSIPLKNDSISIEVYVFSNPEIHIPITTEDIPVNITCSVFNVSGELQFRLKKGSEILVNRSASTGLTIYHTVNPGADQNGQQFTCEAELILHHHSNIIVKQQPATLSVQYSPKKAQISGNQSWTEGHSQILNCSTDANPVPEVRWIKDGETIGRGQRLHVPSVQLGDGGRYTCRVSNDIGSTISSHDVEILYKPRNTTISVNKPVSGRTVLIRKDEVVTMTCHSSGNPEATLKWERPGQGVTEETDYPGLLHISQATSEHTGIYKCRARNLLGTDEEQVEIKMEGDDQKMLMLSWLLPIILFLMVVLICVLINRARKTGHYKAVNAVPHKNQEIPSGNDQESFPLKEVSSKH